MLLAPGLPGALFFKLQKKLNFKDLKNSKEPICLDYEKTEEEAIDEPFDDEVYYKNLIFLEA
jgi:hypothetical protein